MGMIGLKAGIAYYEGDQEISIESWGSNDEEETERPDALAEWEQTVQPDTISSKVFEEYDRPSDVIMEMEVLSGSAKTWITESPESSNGTEVFGSLDDPVCSEIEGETGEVVRSPVCHLEPGKYSVWTSSGQSATKVKMRLEFYWDNKET